MSELRIQGKTVLLTGARGGIGRALTAAFLEAGARTVIAADRSPAPAPSDARVLPSVIDVASASSVAAAAERHGEVDILVNNAGVNGNLGIFEDGAAEWARREIEVNYLGSLNMLRAFAPAMRARRSGAVVQLLSFVALANMPVMGSYSASKAAARSLTQAARAELAPFGIAVLGVFPRMVDTAMTAHLPMAKTSPQDVAGAVIAAIGSGTDETYPGNAEAAHAAFAADPLAIERENGSRLPAASRALLEAA
jgi:NAD(P)-dependent dehydrogenase (short-subunit alcohol dehydrogenase family)